MRLNDVEDILRAALGFREGSLVIYRRGLLIEFKTDLLNGLLSRHEEDGYLSWQVGEFSGHHCHLNLAAVNRVVFGAEPVSCQRGRPNYTVWFESPGDCGNPYRPAAVFSVTLNSPYGADGIPRATIIRQPYDLYERYAGCPGVVAEAGFHDLLNLPALAPGVPAPHSR